MEGGEHRSVRAASPSRSLWWKDYRSEPHSQSNNHIFWPLRTTTRFFLSPHPYLVFYLQTLHSFQPLFYLKLIGFWIFHPYLHLLFISSFPSNLDFFFISKSIFFFVTRKLCNQQKGSLYCNSCGIVLIVSNKHDIWKGGIPIRVSVGTIYHIVAKVFNYKKISL